MMSEESITLSEHKKIVEELFEECEKQAEAGYGEAYEVIKGMRDKITVERQRADIWQTIAQLAKISNYDGVKSLGFKIDDLVKNLRGVADVEVAVSESKCHSKSIKKCPYGGTSHPVGEDYSDVVTMRSNEEF